MPPEARRPARGLRLRRPQEPAAAFAYSVVVGVILFVIVALAAVLPYVVFRALDALGIMPPWLHQPLEWVEYAVFAIDVTGFGCLLVVELFTFVLSLFRKGSDHG